MKKILKYIYVLPAVLFLATIFLMAGKNLSFMAGILEKTSWEEAEALTNQFETNLKENIAEKRELINLNGRMAKLLGMKNLNDRQRLENGYLSVYGGYIPTDDLVQMITGMTSFLDAQGTDYLYVQIPSKPYFYGTVFSEGYENEGHQALEDMMNALAAAGVKNVHMDHWYEENQWGIEDVYFGTDHHWRPEAAFAAMQHVMETMHAMDENIIYDEATLDLDNWNVEVFEDYWVGSDGQRTGAGYAGVDDIAYIYPKFETDISFSNLSFYDEMNYKDSVYYPEYIEKPDYDEGNSYYVYFGENYPLAYIHNSMAVNDRRVIVVGDSYRLPFETFLSTQFTEIYHVDLRFYTSSTFAELVKGLNPDTVLMVYTGPSYAGGDGQYHFGIEEWNEAFAGKVPVKELFSEKEITVSARENDSHYYVVTGNLEAGAYEMTFDRAVVERDAAISQKPAGAYVQASVINLKTGEIIKSRYLHTDMEEAQTWVFSLPEADDSNYAVVLYAGVNHDTAGITANVSGVTLKQYVNAEQ